METFAPHQNIEWLSPGHGVATTGSDANLYVEFRMESVVDHAKSRELGRTVHHDVPFTTIMFPGDKTKKIDRPTKLENDQDGPSDCVRWPNQWKAFQDQEKQAPDGLAIEEWQPLSKSEAKDLKALGIYTVEQLAALPDTALEWLGAREMRSKAQAWIEKANDGSAVMKLSAENSKMREQILMLQKQVQELGELTKNAKTEGKIEKQDEPTKSKGK